MVSAAIQRSIFSGAASISSLPTIRIGVRPSPLSAKSKRWGKERPPSASTPPTFTPLTAFVAQVRRLPGQQRGQFFSRRFCGNDGSSVRWDLQRFCQRRLLPHAETTSSHQRRRPDREYFIRIGSNCSSRKLCVWRGQRSSLGALWCTGRHWADDRRTSFGRQSVGQWAAHRGIGLNVTVSPPNSESRPGRRAANQSTSAFWLQLCSSAYIQ